MSETISQAKKLLLVEDEEQTLLAMRSYLTRQGYEVSCTQELHQALSLISEIEFSLVLTDLRLGGTNGVEGLDIVSHVRATSPRTKVIILTAYGTREVEAEARRRGADDFLYKTEPLAVVAKIIHDHLSGRLQRTEA